MHFLYSFFVSVAYLTLFSQALTKHSANECSDQDFNTYNASASAYIHPLSQNVTNSSLASWKLGTAVKEVVDRIDSVSIVKQKWWLEGDSKISANASLQPIEGCIIYLEASPNSTFLGKGANNTVSQNGCSNAMTAECQTAILNRVTFNITGLNDQDLNNHWTICPKIAHLLFEPPAECQAKYNLNSVALQPFGNPEFFAPAENGCDNSTEFNIFEGSATRNSFLEIPYPPSSIGNHKMYDAVVETTNPFLLVSWPHNRTQAWWPDAQLACLTPSSDITNGSRVPSANDARSNIASITAQGESLFALWMLLLTVTLLL